MSQDDPGLSGGRRGSARLPQLFISGSARRPLIFGSLL